MNIDIRRSIKDNFKDSGIEDLKNSIEESINDQDEITLPGLGVLFELLWTNCDKDDREFLLRTIEKGL